jgi:hypothetical protein
MDTLLQNTSCNKHDENSPHTLSPRSRAKTPFTTPLEPAAKLPFAANTATLSHQYTWQAYNKQLPLGVR